MRPMPQPAGFSFRSLARLLVTETPLDAAAPGQGIVLTGGVLSNHRQLAEAERLGEGRLGECPKGRDSGNS